MKKENLMKQNSALVTETHTHRERNRKIECFIIFVMYIYFKNWIKFSNYRQTNAFQPFNSHNIQFDAVQLIECTSHKSHKEIDVNKLCTHLNTIVFVYYYFNIISCHSCYSFADTKSFSHSHSEHIYLCYFC